MLFLNHLKLYQLLSALVGSRSISVSFLTATGRDRLDRRLQIRAKRSCFLSFGVLLSPQIDPQESLQSLDSPDPSGAASGGSTLARPHRPPPATLHLPESLDDPQCPRTLPPAGETKR